MRVAILNYADVRNFGDVLFPLVIAREIRARLSNVEIEYVTATGSSWAGMMSQRFDRIDLDSFDALILGGGEIVHRQDDMLKKIYHQFKLVCIERPTDIVFGWSSAKAPFKAWIALGTPEPERGVRADIRSTIRWLNYVGARGSRSAARLAGGGPILISRTPDLGWLFPRLLEGRTSAYPVGGEPYIAVQALGFSNVEATVSAFRRISAKTGLRIVLLPLTRCWQDVVPLGDLHKCSGGRFSMVDDATDDLDKLAILGGATLFVGQSMHGFIGSLSQCRPAGICMPEADDKFGELLRDLDLQQFRSESWDGVERLIQTIIWSPPGLIAQRRLAAAAELDQLFDDLCQAMKARAV